MKGLMGTTVGGGNHGKMKEIQLQFMVEIKFGETVE